MAKIGKGYGSEYHLLKHLSDRCHNIERAIAQCLEVKSDQVKWVKPDDGQPREWKGMDFLREDERVMSEWRQFWPQRGNPPNWDAVARLVAPQNEE